MIPVPAGISPEGLQVAIGLYDPQTGARLSASDPTGTPLQDAAIRLAVGAPGLTP